jgi:hypothetical protein
MDDPSKKRRLPFALDPGPWDALPGGSVAVLPRFNFLLGLASGWGAGR